MKGEYFLASGFRLLPFISWLEHAAREFTVYMGLSHSKTDRLTIKHRASCHQRKATEPGDKTDHVAFDIQLEHVFASRVHA